MGRQECRVKGMEEDLAGHRHAWKYERMSGELELTRGNEHDPEARASEVLGQRVGLREACSIAEDGESLTIEPRHRLLLPRWFEAAEVEIAVQFLTDDIPKLPFDYCRLARAGSDNCHFRHTTHLLHRTDVWCWLSI